MLIYQLFRHSIFFDKRKEIARAPIDLSLNLTNTLCGVYLLLLYSPRQDLSNHYWEVYIKIEKIFEERVEENRKLFTEKDMLTINNNKDIMKKIYLLGLINGRDIYNIK